MPVKIDTEMPTNCYQCIFSESYVPDGRTVWCVALFDRVRAYTTKRNKKCPLKECR